MKTPRAFTRTLLVGAAGAFLSTVASANVRVAPYFSDRAVLQSGMKVPIWGWASAGERITVFLNGQTKSVTADGSGKWLVNLDPMPPTARDAPSSTLEIDGSDDRLVFNDVLVGEVWLCAGQSNMEFPLAKALRGLDEASGSDHVRVRQFLVPFGGSAQPEDAAFIKSGSWEACSRATAAKFSAVGYYFAREISQALGGVPVAVITAAKGSSPIAAWMPLSAIKSIPGRDEELTAAKAKDLANWPNNHRKFLAAEAEWDAQAASAKLTGQPPPSNKPTDPGPPDSPQYMPTFLYNGMIAPLLPYAVRGCLWYQGESNAGFGRKASETYAGMQMALIRTWRRAWGEGDLPFYFVQLPNWFSSADKTGQSWAFLRASQADALSLPNTGMAVSIDVGENANIHPTNKQPVGHRLALLALKRMYHQSVIDEGPVYDSLEAADHSRLRLRFRATESGLFSKDGPPRNFQVAGADQKFYPADAVIEKDDVLVSSASVSRPIAARYAWTNDPVGCNLYNKADLPAMPFRTDDW